MRPRLRKDLNPFIERDLVAARGENEGQHPHQGRTPVPRAEARFGFTKVHYRGLGRTVQLITFALSAP
jgi:hypothetical protein